MDLETRTERPLKEGDYAEAAGGPWLADNRTVFRRIGGKQRPETLSLFDTETGQATDLGSDDHGPWTGVVASGNYMFSSDERTLVYIRWNSERKAMVAIRRDLVSGTSSETVVARNQEADAEYSFQVAMDLKTVYYSVVPKEKSAERPSRIFRCDLKSGMVEEFMRSPHFLGPFSSPDSAQVAVAEAPTYWERTVTLYSLKTSPPTKLWSVQAPPPAVIYGWTSDGRYLICRGPGTDDHQARVEPCPITLISADGEVIRTDLKIPQMGYIAGVDVVRGRIYMILREPPVREVWVVENLFANGNVGTAVK